MNPRQVYVVDHALVRAAAPSPREDLGHGLANIACFERRRRGEVHGHHVTTKGSES